MTDLFAIETPRFPPHLRSATETGFLDPEGKNLAAVRGLLHRLIDDVTHELAAARELSPVPLDWPEIDQKQLIPDHPVSGESLLSVSRDLIRGSMNPAHPRYLGHMDPLPSTGSVMASLITAAVNNNLLSREMSPVFSDLEQRLMREMAGLFGLPGTAGGMLQSGGTLCNLLALTVARNERLKRFGVRHQGFSQVTGQPVLFASELCHSSIQKSAMIMGLGTEAVIPIATDADCKMRPDALQRAIQTAREQGQIPFCVVGTAGTTVTGTLDPLSDLAAICQQENLWFHVDASYGGAIVFSDRERHRLAGVEQADSLTFNPQKWCYVTKTCAMVLFRDELQVDEAYRISAPYMSMNEDGGEVNLGEWGVQGTRAPDVAKWWLTLLQFGKTGLGQLIDHSYRLTEQLVREIEARDYLERAAPAELNLICFRDRRGGSSEEDRGDWNQRLQRALLDECDTFLSLPRFRDSRWLKAVVLNPYTTSEDFAEIFRFMDAFQG